MKLVIFISECFTDTQEFICTRFCTVKGFMKIK